jgi:hypothetical protein
MSEYQYYEFLALDRPLTSKQREELRQLSTRAEITATRFSNEYHWGDFRGDPEKLMARYFDAFLYLANGGKVTPPSYRHLTRLSAAWPAGQQNQLLERQGLGLKLVGL